MKVTLEDIQKQNGCGAGVNWFAKKYPNGVEMIDLINDPEITNHQLHWGFNWMNTTPEEKEAYYKVLNIECENNGSIILCDNVKNSLCIYKGSEIENCEYIMTSRRIKSSRFIRNSRDVVDSNFVFQGKNIESSSQIMKSNNVYESKDVVDSTWVTGSNSINNSHNIENSGWIFQSEDINNCAFLNNCKNLSNCYFCHDLQDKEYHLFNQPVSKTFFEKVTKQIQQYTTKFSMNVFNINWTTTEFPNLKTPAYNYNWSTYYDSMPDEFWENVRLLPNYDDLTLYFITYKKF